MTADGMGHMNDNEAPRNGTIARIQVDDGPLQSWPLAERVTRGWQSGVNFYPDDKVVKIEAIYVRSERIDRWLAAHDAKVKAEAWDEGHRTRQRREMDDCNCNAWSEGECACGLYGTGKIITPNPYRIAS